MKKFLKRFYRFLTSTQLAIILIILLIIFMVIGTIFPQGGTIEQYISAFGQKAFNRLAPLGVLDIFHSWYFITVGAILYINLFLGTLQMLIKERRKRTSFKSKPVNAREIPVKGDFTSLKQMLRKRGFRFRVVKDDEQAASLYGVRGLPKRPVSIFYHFFFGISIFGFILSALTKFDGNIDMEIGDVHQVPLSSESMAIYRLFREFDPAKVEFVELELKDYEMEYVPFRMGYFPKDYISTLVARFMGKEKEMRVEVNRPLKFGGLTFFQWSYGQRFELAADEETLSLESGDVFTVDGIMGMLKTGTVYTGKVFADSGVSDIVPYTKLMHTKEVGGWHEVAKLVLNEPVEVMGTHMVLLDVRDVSGIHYVRDDGVGFLYVGFFLFMLGLCVRVFARTYQIRLYFDKQERRAYVKGSASGIGTYSEHEIDAIERVLSAAE